METINSIAAQIHQLAVEKGWHVPGEIEDQFIERMCNNLHDEVSELHEAWRNNRLHEPCDKADGMIALGKVPLSCLEEEMADILIRALDNCITLGLNPELIIYTKHLYNATRAQRHSGKKS